MQVTLFSMRTVEGQHEKLHQCCIMRKAMSKEVGAGGRLDIILDSAESYRLLDSCDFLFSVAGDSKQHLAC